MSFKQKKQTKKQKKTLVLASDSGVLSMLTDMAVTSAGRNPVKTAVHVVHGARDILLRTVVGRRSSELSENSKFCGVGRKRRHARYAPV